MWGGVIPSHWEMGLGRQLCASSRKIFCIFLFQNGTFSAFRHANQSLKKTAKTVKHPVSHATLAARHGPLNQLYTTTDNVVL